MMHETRIQVVDEIGQCQTQSQKEGADGKPYELSRNGKERFIPR